MKRGYDLIAGDFSRKRQGLWPELLPFAGYVKPGGRVLDVGCGNGRLRALFKDMDVRYTGVDNSNKLLRLAKENQELRIKNQEFAVTDALALPFGDNRFDAVFSVAVLHHIPSDKLRLKFLREAGRVLRDDGALVVTVWNLRRLKFLKYRVRALLNKKLGPGDILYPWKNEEGETVLERYFHCFAKGELVRLFKKAGFRIEEAGFTKKRRNIYAVGRPSLNG